MCFLLCSYDPIVVKKQVMYEKEYLNISATPLAGGSL